jgi:hypothetical protein
MSPNTHVDALPGYIRKLPVFCPVALLHCLALAQRVFTIVLHPTT